MECTVREDANEVRKYGKDMAQAMRRLKKGLNQCKECVKEDTCPILKEINQEIYEAVTEINIEWGLA